MESVNAEVSLCRPVCLNCVDMGVLGVIKPDKIVRKRAAKVAKLFLSIAYSLAIKSSVGQAARWISVFVAAGLHHLV